MNKLGLFTLVVFAGVALMLIASNQTGMKVQSTNTIDLNLSPTPSPAVSPTQIPNLTPAQPTPEGATPAAQINSAIIKTSKGDITIAFFSNDARNTVTNFVQKSQSGFYNNLTFHRVEDWVVQGGDPKGTGTGGGNMATELNDHPFVVGSVGIARGGDIKVSNDAQFFITKKESSFLNGQYTNFGQVTSGMDVVEKIEIGDKILGISVQ